MTTWFRETADGAGITLETGALLHESQSAFQNIKVIETTAYGNMLLLDDLVMTTDKDEFIYHEMITHVAMLSHPNPKRVLVIGGGDGGTVREVLKHDCVEEVLLCEIDGEVIEVSKQFFPTIASEFNNPKLKVTVGDGVAFIKQFADAFDVVLVDSSDPISFGEGLFNRAFYSDVFNALKADGILVAQTDGPYPKAPTLHRVYPIFKELFPIATAYWGHIPTYPGALWTWSFCSKHYPAGRIASETEARLEKIEPTCQYYNRDLHAACFALPTFLKQLVHGQTPVVV
jgi:spermidine synthase